MDLYFCVACGARVPVEDVKSGAAFVDSAQNTVVCKTCTEASIHDMPTGTDFRPVEDVPQTLPVKQERRSSRLMLAAQASNKGAEARPGPPPSKAPMIGLAAGGVMLVVSVLIFLFKPASGPAKNSEKEMAAGTASKTSTGANTGASAAPTATVGGRSQQQPGPYCIFLVNENKDALESMLTGEAMFSPTSILIPMLPDDAPPPPPVAVDGLTVLAKLELTSFKGGVIVKNVAKKGRDGRTIYGQKHADAAMTARFDLKLPSNGPASVSANAYRDAKAPCTIAIQINGHEVFRGPEPADAADTWSVQSFKVPDGIIQAGRNELRISNVEPSAAAGPPDYTIGGVEVRGALPAAPPPAAEPPKPVKPDVAQPARTPEPEFPPVLTGEQKAALQFMDSVFTPLAKLDTEPAIRLASTDSTPGGKRLAAALNSARDELNKAIAAINKSGGTISVHVTAGTLDLTGQILRIEGARAWIKSRGLEVPVDIGALPHEVFVKALGSSESTPQGRLDKSLLEIALGDIDAAAALMRKAGNHAASADLAALLEQRAKLLTLQKFETELNELAALAGSDRAADVAGKIAKLKHEAPELSEQHKQRIDYITERAKAKK